MEEQVADKQAVSANSAEGRRMAAAANAARERSRQALELQRERILSERTSSPVRRAALERALAEIEAQLNSLT